jgi:hypothetical protein
MRATVLDVQHKKRLVAGAPTLLWEAQPGFTRRPLPARRNMAINRRGQIRRPRPCHNGPIQTGSLAQKEVVFSQGRSSPPPEWGQSLSLA